MSSSPLARAARATTAPVRDFFNRHFEMVKDEVRAAGANSQGGSLHETLADLESDLLETTLHQARLTAGLRQEIEQLTSQIESLERTVDRLSEVLAASTRSDS